MKLDISGISVISFQGLVQHGIDSGVPLVNGMPWSFSYRNHPVTHEHDGLYLISNEQFTPDDLLIVNKAGKLIFIRN